METGGLEIRYLKFAFLLPRYTPKNELGFTNVTIVFVHRRLQPIRNPC